MFSCCIHRVNTGTNPSRSPRTTRTGTHTKVITAILLKCKNTGGDARLSPVHSLVVTYPAGELRIPKVNL